MRRVAPFVAAAALMAVVAPITFVPAPAQAAE